MVDAAGEHPQCPRSRTISNGLEKEGNVRRYVIVFAVMALMVGLLAAPASAGSGNQQLSINVLLNTSINDSILTDLGDYGRVTDELYEINAVFMKARAKDLDAIRSLPYVAAANPDAKRDGAPIDTVAVTNFANGLNTWNLDAINVTNYGSNSRTVDQDGTGVYVAVLDTGLVDSWRQYFPEERIATEFAKSFGGGGNEHGHVSTQPNKWEHDQNSHGTHVTSTILGYSLGGTPINGVAPMATVIPVKVLNQNGSGWSSMVAAGVMYVTDLKMSGALDDAPVVINMSLGGPVQDPVEQAADDYAIANGVILVASAGNEGQDGMGYPGAYAPVISAAASGWVGEWSAPSWWWALNVADPTNPDDFYITDFSSRALPGQDLDVAAPGSWVVGPYQVNSGQTSYYYLGGTSMASPHVAGTVALMLQKDPALTARQAERILQGAAIPLPPGCRTVNDGSGSDVDYCWRANATGSGLLDAAAALAVTPTP